MKIFTFYYDRFDTATTSKMLNAKHIVLCHNNAKKFTCIGKKGNLIETKQPKGLQHNFNYALEMMEDGEWAIFMSDDMVTGKILKGEKYINCEPEIVLKKLQDIIPTADKIGVKLIGFTSTGNPFYAKNPYSKYGLVDGRCFAIKKTEFRFHKEINTIPDYYATAYHLSKYGGNLVLNHYFIDFKRYEKGGLGSVNERIADKIKNVQLMKMLFPKNVVIKDKPNEPAGSHIMIKR